MESLYILQLANGKYYVGKTTDVKRRIKEHMSGHGSEWTKLYHPIKVLETRHIKDQHDENNTTKDLMKKYGVDNVRGGSYSQVILPSAYKETIDAEIRGTNGTCFKCGKKGHFANICIEDIIEDIDEVLEEVWECEYCDEEFNSRSACERHEKSCGRQLDYVTASRSSGSCYRCGRKGHWAPDCYARSHVKGYELD